MQARVKRSSWELPVQPVRRVPVLVEAGQSHRAPAAREYFAGRLAGEAPGVRSALRRAKRG